MKTIVNILNAYSRTLVDASSFIAMKHCIRINVFIISIYNQVMPATLFKTALIYIYVAGSIINSMGCDLLISWDLIKALLMFTAISFIDLDFAVRYK